MMIRECVPPKQTIEYSYGICADSKCNSYGILRGHYLHDRTYYDFIVGKAPDDPNFIGYCKNCLPPNTVKVIQ
jgi:hypothetical protein